MALPLHYVERIHKRLAVRYGSAWMAKWAGIAQRDVQADWALQLDGMSEAQIIAALQNLPEEFPPTCVQFRKLGESHRAPDASDVLRLQDERGGTKPSLAVLAKLKELAGRSARNVTDELSHD